MTATPTTHSPSSAILQPLEGTKKWNGTIGIHFLDPNDASEVTLYENLVAAEGLQTNSLGLSAQWQAEIMAAFARWSDVANISVEIADISSANYIVGDLDAPTTYGLWNFPDSSQQLAAFSTNNPYMTPAAEAGGGSDRTYTFLHEVGHALGLGHPFDAGNGTSLQPYQDDYYAPQTVMSYTINAVDPLTYGTTFGLPVTPMAYDIAAVQNMYGANMSTNTGDTEYSLFDPQTSALDLDGSDGSIGIGRAYYCIWDAGGDADTIAYDEDEDVLINLNAATLTNTNSNPGMTLDPAIAAALDALQVSHGWSRLSGDTQSQILDTNMHSAGFFSSILDNNGQRIAGGYTIANGVVIEDAKGGSGDDVILGNAAGNLLVGSDGSDVLLGADGDDLLVGGSADGWEKDWQTHPLASGDGADWCDNTPDFLDGGSGYDVYFTGVDYTDGSSQWVSTTGYRTGSFNDDIYQYIDVISDTDGDGLLVYRLAGVATDMFPMPVFGEYQHTNDPYYGYYAGLTHYESTQGGLHFVIHDYVENGETFERLVFFQRELSVAVFAVENFTNGDFGLDIEGFEGANNGGDGNDSLTGNSLWNRMYGGDGNDTIDAKAGNDSLYGEAGNDTLYGRDGDDEIHGGSGDDYLLGEAGNDTYFFDLGDGSDTVEDSGGGAEVDRLIIGAASTEIQVQRGTSSIWDMELVIGTNGDSITVIDHFGDSQYFLEEIHLSDSVVWTEADLRAIYLAQHSTSSADEIHGFWLNDDLGGLAGDDTIYAYGGDDTITGGTGDDYLEGLQGSDTYIYNLGDGADTIQEWSDPELSVDEIVFGASFDPADIVVQRSPGDFYSLLITNTLDGGSIEVLGQFDDPMMQIEQFVFADSTVWTAEDVRSQILESLKTTGDDEIVGFYSDDEIHGGAGEDSIYGEEGDDIIYGESGDDLLFGGDGDDTFMFAPGDGYDWIVDFAAGAGTDDIIDLTALSGFEDLSDVLNSAFEISGATILDFGNDEGIGLAGVTLSTLHADDFRFAA